MTENHNSHSVGEEEQGHRKERSSRRPNSSDTTPNPAAPYPPPGTFYGFMYHGQSYSPNIAGSSTAAPLFDQLCSIPQAFLSPGFSRILTSPLQIRLYFHSFLMVSHGLLSEVCSLTGHMAFLQKVIHSLIGLSSFLGPWQVLPYPHNFHFGQS